ncbi:MAG TPA: MDR family MFS transporter [Caulobacteraceae bacterium]|nr:MDR family MFS transporter [Caulobacteraceae bacterium]
MDERVRYPERAASRVALAMPRAAGPDADDKPFSSLAPAIIGSALLMQTLDATVLANALPTMAHTLHVDPIRLNAAITMYLLSSAIFLPISGWAADRFGAKRIFLFAIAGFALACAACGFAKNINELLAARFAQGAAGAMMGPVGRLVLLRSTPKHDLVRAMSVLTMPALLGPVIGPPIGGAIVTYGSWRWIFFLNLPIAALGLVLVARFIPDVREQETTPLDWTGLVLTGVGMAGVVYGFDNLGRNAFPPWAVALMLGGGAALLAAYVLHARRTPHAILDLDLFRIPTFSASVVGGAFMRMGMGATPFILALLLQLAFGLTAFEAGMMTFASAAAALVMKTCAPPILAFFGFKRTLSVNAVIVAISFAGYALFRPTTPHWLIYAVLLFGGFFRSLQFTSLNGLAFADVDNAQMSRASTMSTMGQQLSQSIGIGLAATLLHFSLMHAHARHLTAQVIAPTYYAVAAVAFVSFFFFLPLPADAGAGLHGRPRARLPA